MMRRCWWCCSRRRRARSTGRRSRLGPGLRALHIARAATAAGRQRVKRARGGNERLLGARGELLATAARRTGRWSARRHCRRGSGSAGSSGSTSTRHRSGACPAAGRGGRGRRLSRHRALGLGRSRPRLPAQAVGEPQADGQPRHVLAGVAVDALNEFAAGHTVVDLLQRAPRRVGPRRGPRRARAPRVRRRRRPARRPRGQGGEGPVARRCWSGPGPVRSVRARRVPSPSLGGTPSGVWSDGVATAMAPLAGRRTAESCRAPRTR